MSAYTPKRSRRGLRLVVALALASTAAGGVYLYSSTVQRQVQQQQQEASVIPTLTPRRSVVVARADLPAKPTHRRLVRGAATCQWTRSPAWRRRLTRSRARSSTAHWPPGNS